MYSDPFYRQLVRVMQENGKEVASTRQSARYKDDLQTNRSTSGSIVKQKARKRYKVEIPTHYTPEKIDTINRIIWSWKLQRLECMKEARLERITILRTRIAELKQEEEQIKNQPKESETNVDSN
jgi:spermidine synthase